MLVKKEKMVVMFLEENYEIYLDWISSLKKKNINPHPKIALNASGLQAMYFIHCNNQFLIYLFWGSFQFKPFLVVQTNLQTERSVSKWACTMTPVRFIAYACLIFLFLYIGKAFDEKKKISIFSPPSYVLFLYIFF